MNWSGFDQLLKLFRKNITTHHTARRKKTAAADSSSRQQRTKKFKNFRFQI